MYAAGDEGMGLSSCVWRPRREPSGACVCYRSGFSDPVHLQASLPSHHQAPVWSVGQTCQFYSHQLKRLSFTPENNVFTETFKIMFMNHEFCRSVKLLQAPAISIASDHRNKAHFKEFFEEQVVKLGKESQQRWESL